MSFADAIRTCFSKYADFSGRARRSEYWFFYLFTVIVMIVVSLVDQAIGTYPLLYAVAGLALLVPILASGTRRLHDTGRSGVWWLIAFIPLIGAILLIVWFCGDSAPDNEYGPSPKGAPAGYGTAPA
jgi:uncharacterized membrane protein YhaH (DUF805 family)